VNKMDRMGANFERCVGMIKDRLGAVPVPIQMPIGAEDHFEGMIDLVAMKEMTFTGERGKEASVGEVRESMAEAAQAARDTMCELVAENDDEAMEVYLNGDPLSNELLVAAIRRATIAGKITPVLCGSALKDKGLQPLL